MKSLLQLLNDLPAEISPSCFTYWSDVRTQRVEWFTSVGGKVSVERNLHGEIQFIDRHREVILVNDLNHLAFLVRKFGS